MTDIELALWALVNRLFHYDPATGDFTHRAVAVSYDLVERIVRELVAGDFEDFDLVEAVRWVRRSKDVEPFPSQKVDKNG